VTGQPAEGSGVDWANVPGQVQAESEDPPSGCFGGAGDELLWRVPQVGLSCWFPASLARPLYQLTKPDRRSDTARATAVTSRSPPSTSFLKLMVRWVVELGGVTSR